MADTFRRIWQNIYLRVIFLVALAYGLFWLLRTTQLAWSSFLIAFLIAYLVEPIVERLDQSRIIRRWMSVTLVIIGILLFFILSVVLASRVVAQLSALPAQVLPLLERVPEWLGHAQENAPPIVSAYLAENAEGVQDFVDEQQRQLSRWAQQGTRRLVGVVRTVFGGLGRALLVLALSGFIISSYTAIQQSFLKAFPTRYHDMAFDLGAKLNESVGGYVRAKVVEAIIVGFVVWLVLLLMGVPQAPALGFLAAVLNPIPYLGPFVATIPVTLSALTISWQLAVIAFFVMGIIQVLDGNLLAPILLSQGVSVHPVTVLLALVIGSALFGLWGVIPAIPVAAFLQLMYRDYYLKSKWYLGDAPLTTPEPARAEASPETSSTPAALPPKAERSSS